MIRLLHYNPKQVERSNAQPTPVSDFPRSNKLTTDAEDRYATSTPGVTYLGEYTGERFETDVLDHNGNPISFPKRNIGQTVSAGTQYTIRNEPYTVENNMSRKEFLERCDAQLETPREVIPLMVGLASLAAQEFLEKYNSPLETPREVIPLMVGLASLTAQDTESKAA